MRGPVSENVIPTPLIIGAVNVLFDRVSAPVNYAKFASDTAELNCAKVPVTVLLLSEIVLFVSVADIEFFNSSLVLSTFPKPSLALVKLCGLSVLETCCTIVDTKLVVV
jgi:hypothetical protein